MLSFVNRGSWGDTADWKRVLLPGSGALDCELPTACLASPGPSFSSVGCFSSTRFLPHSQLLQSQGPAMHGSQRHLVAKSFLVSPLRGFVAESLGWDSSPETVSCSWHTRGGFPKGKILKGRFPARSAGTAPQRLLCLSVSHWPCPLQQGLDFRRAFYTKDLPVLQFCNSQCSKCCQYFVN